MDYQGDVVKFSEEFADDLATIAFAVKKYNLPANLKLSVHSGSDKFSIYPPMRRHFEVRRGRAFENSRYNMAGRIDWFGRSRR